MMAPHTNTHTPPRDIPMQQNPRERGRPTREGALSAGLNKTAREEPRTSTHQNGHRCAKLLGKLLSSACAKRDPHHGGAHCIIYSRYKSIQCAETSLRQKGFAHRAFARSFADEGWRCSVRSTGKGKKGYKKCNI